MPTYKIKIEGLDKLQGAIKKSPKLVVRELGGAIKTSINIIRPIMKQEAPHGKGDGKGYTGGRLRENIYAKYSKLTGEVGPDLRVTPYAYWVHQGTRPYIIRAKPGKALYWPGARHPVKMVRHPGIKANPFVDRTHKRSEPIVVKIFDNAIKNVLKNLK